MIEPFAPLYPWLREALKYAYVRVSNGSGYCAHDAIVGRLDMDLRDLQTRAAILRALADAGHSRPWALGAPWSPLTDEQAGRATAAIVRAVGPDPAHPVAAVPNRVLDEWERPSTACDGRTELLPADDGTIPAWPLFINREGWIIQGGQAQGNRDRDRFTVHASGPETGDAGRLAADNAARSMGCLMIEDLTP